MKTKVFLTGGDNTNWALDDDLRLVKAAVQDVVELVGIKECDVIHSMWWSGLNHIPEELLIGKRIISQVPGEPFRYYQLPHYSRLASKIGHWVTQTKQAQQQLQSIGIPSTLIPYTINTDIFHSLNPQDPTLTELRQKWQIPDNVYLIGSFQRDTEGHDLTSPKLVKGPDIFVEIVRALHQQGYPIHVVLAGPRRYWIRQALENYQIPYTFIGKEIAGKDDAVDNTLPQTTLNLLYNLLDLYLISSRSEGGPRSVLEAAAAKCKVVSTPIGLPLDILHADAIYHSPPDAVDIIAQDITQNHLQHTLEAQYQTVIQNHQPHSVTPLFQALYAQASQIKPYTPSTTSTPRQTSRLQPAYVRLVLSSKVSSAGILKKTWRKWIKPTLKKAKAQWQQRKQRPSTRQDQLTVGLWHEFFKPPYGGGNQFMLAMRKGLQACDKQVVENVFQPFVDVYLLNSIHFDVEQFLNFRQKHPAKVVHRIDGPIYLIRGYDKDKDDLCYQLNKQFASMTILQSQWTYQRICDTGYYPVNPVIINNAVDPTIFHTQGRIPFDPHRKIKLISTSWSGNPRKGGATYKWIEEHLDWDRFDYTFVGRASESFDRIHQIDPVPSDELADLLRQHDVYITASQKDPCSNALIEALSCGLPALYFNDGGHPELVGYGGLPFNDEADILPQLDKLVANYSMFQNLITVSRLDDAVEKYMAVMREAIVE